MSNEHLGGCYPEGDGNTSMKDVWGWLAVEYNLQSLVDVGCGYGHAMQFFEDYMISCEGVEGYQPAIYGKVCRSPILDHDYTNGKLPEAKTRQWNLAWCAEVLEHIEEQYLPNLMHTFKACEHVCATHALPNQHGHHHVNCQTTDYWVNQFQQIGFEYDSANTDKLRLSDRWSAPWGRKTLMLFHRK